MKGRRDTRKSEARNPKSETISNDQIRILKTVTEGRRALVFRTFEFLILDLFRISCLEFRACKRCFRPAAQSVYSR